MAVNTEYFHLWRSGFITKSIAILGDDTFIDFHEIRNESLRENKYPDSVIVVNIDPSIMLLH